MCGRFALTLKASELASIFELGLQGLRVEERHQIAPGEWILIVRPNPSGKRSWSQSKWGFQPPWNHDRPGYINARGESLGSKPAFRRAFQEGRCLIPASGYFEWTGEGQNKRACFIYPKDAPVFALAGLETNASDPGSSTCAIITTAAASSIASHHDRMPLILGPEDWSLWLAPETPTLQLEALITAYSPEKLAWIPLSRKLQPLPPDGPSLFD